LSKPIKSQAKHALPLVPIGFQSIRGKVHLRHLVTGLAQMTKENFHDEAIAALKTGDTRRATERVDGSHG
jgi:hypothetical protein